MPRLPTPPANGKLPADFEKYQANPGFASAIMIDLQRVFICLDIEPGENQPPVDTTYFQMVMAASQSFSSKVVLPMSANSEWRTEGFEFQNESKMMPGVSEII